MVIQSFSQRDAACSKAVPWMPLLKNYLAAETFDCRLVSRKSEGVWVCECVPPIKESRSMLGLLHYYDKNNTKGF